MFKSVCLSLGQMFAISSCIPNTIQFDIFKISVASDNIFQDFINVPTVLVHMSFDHPLQNVSGFTDGSMMQSHVLKKSCRAWSSCRHAL